MNPALLFAPLLALLILCGCSSPARRLEVGPVRHIVPGRTTMAEVEKQFGPPQEKEVGEKGRTVVRYFYRSGRVNNHVDPNERHHHPADILFRTLTLLHGPDAIVRKKLHDESVVGIHRYNASLIAGPSLLPENINFIKSRTTTRKQLIERLGEPISRTYTVHGNNLLIWVSIKAHEAFTANFESRRLLVVLDDIDVVTDFSVVETDEKF